MVGVTHKFVLDQMKEQIDTCVPGSNCLSLQFDIWSAPDMTPFGALVGSVLTDDWELRTFNMGCDFFRERHSGVEIRTFIFETLGTHTSHHLDI